MHVKKIMHKERSSNSTMYTSLCKLTSLL